MNLAPHTHNPKLRYNDYRDEWQIEYGDTTVRVCNKYLFLMTWFPRANPSPSQVRSALKTAIRKHDSGTRRAARLEAKSRSSQGELDEILDQVISLPAHEWASRSLK